MNPLKTLQKHFHSIFLNLNKIKMKVILIFDDLSKFTMWRDYEASKSSLNMWMMRGPIQKFRQH